MPARTSEATGTIRVVVVDDHKLFAESLARLLDEDPALRVVGTACTARSGIDLAATERADVVLMDYSLPDMDGASAARQLRAQLPDVAVILITGSERPDVYVAAMNAGCAGTVRKTRAVHELLDVIHRAGSGERVRREEYEEFPSLQELVVHYQPVVRLADRSVVGFEALVRWQHPRKGLLPPGQFVPIAEETGHIVDIGRHVTRQALTDLTAWQRDRGSQPRLWVAVNMSAVTVSVPNIAEQFRDIVSDVAADPAELVLEITETVFLDDTPLVTENMHALRDIGVKLALDDFGTAFSSLSNLRRFPFDHVKIDTSFTAELPHSIRAVQLIESIQLLIASMGASSIAEGIERPEQAACLIDRGWELGQGFLYRPAVPFAEATALARGTVLL